MGIQRTNGVVTAGAPIVAYDWPCPDPARSEGMHISGMRPRIPGGELAEQRHNNGVRLGSQPAGTRARSLKAALAGAQMHTCPNEDWEGD